MCAVVMAVGGNNNKFILIAAINIVVAANAGGILALWRHHNINGMAKSYRNLQWCGGFLVVLCPVCSFTGELAGARRS